MAITSSGMFWLTQEKHLTNATGTVSWEGTPKYALCTDSWTPAFDTMDFRDDVSNVANMNDAEFTTGGGYTNGGNAIGSPALTISSGMKYDFTDPQWTSVTLSGVMGGFAHSGQGTDSTDELFFLHDFVTAVNPSNGTLDVAIHTNGAVTWA